MLFGFFCFFKQKTAYEMRISDWSSDVCSSDLKAILLRRPFPALILRQALDKAPSQPNSATGIDSRIIFFDVSPFENAACHNGELGRASCRERVCQYV